jgi:hypothetical protein
LLDRIGAQLHLSPEQLQQHLDVLTRHRAGKISAPAGEQTGGDLTRSPVWCFHLGSSMVPLRSRFRISDHLVGHVRWLVTAHHQLDHARASTDATPLQLDACEQVSGKQGQQHLDAAALAVTPLANLRQINLVTGPLEEILCDLLATRLQSGRCPYAGSPHDAQAAEWRAVLRRGLLAEELARTIAVRLPASVVAAGGSRERHNRAITR